MPLSIIGAGFGRTGTTSLQAALDHLRCGPCFKEASSAIATNLWYRARKGLPIDWDDLLRGYGATLDFPSCLFYRELAAKYPLAKVILTVRDPDDWFDSVKVAFMDRLDGMTRTAQTAAAMDYAIDLLSTVLGPDFRDRAAAIAAYERHTVEVQDSIPAHRLLRYDVLEGWDPLCRFLEMSIPDVPFPHLNSKDARVPASSSRKY